MPASENNKAKVRISLNGMEAFLQIPVPDEFERYTIESIRSILSAKGVVYGVNDSVIADMARRGPFNKEVLVAQGTPPVDGIDGYYEYLFKRDKDSRPMIREDGSADYWSVNSINQVMAGEVIARYHPSVQGKNGRGVRGNDIIAKRGKEQALLKGKGFSRSEDNSTYTADIDGKIETQNDRIVILPIHEVNGDADLTIGKIDFHGDVIIHGNVESGVSVKASGTITVDGTVEACKLEAGKDIILRGGMLGGNKASVVTKGNIFAKFFENTFIQADGIVQADVFMNCMVRSKEKVILKGNRGSIIGGEINAVQGVESCSIGNNAETRTMIFAGAGADINSRLSNLQKKVEDTRNELQKIEQALEKFKTIEKERGVNYASDPRRMALLRVRIKDTALLAEDEASIRELQQLIERGRGAAVTVADRVYPGVVINIDNTRMTIKNIAANVEFYLLEDVIRTRAAK